MGWTRAVWVPERERHATEGEGNLVPHLTETGVVTSIGTNTRDLGRPCV